MKQFIMVLMVSLITILTMRGLHAYGTYERGYPAFGGEILISALPIVGAALIHDEKRYRARLFTKKEEEQK